MIIVLMCSGSLTMAQRQVLRSIYKIEKLEPLTEPNNHYTAEIICNGSLYLPVMERILNECGPKITIKKYAVKGNHLPTY